jgi:hypothetical protein
MMIDLASPRFIDALIALVAIEGVFLYFTFPALRRTPDLWLTLASGAALMLALRVALAGGGSIAIGAALTAALVAHLLYLRARLKK